jgi:TatD DNase family protein
MTFIDTHCHLYLDEFAQDIEETVQRAENEGVKKFFLPSIDQETFSSVLQLEERFPGKCHAMAGLHPCSVKGSFRQELDFVKDQLAMRRFAAVGEIGLDFYWDRTFEKEQYEAFRVQLDWALDHDLPVVIHSRQSMAETIFTVKEKQHGKLKGIFHCFNDTLQFATEIIDLGFYLGIGGVLTYKNSKLPDVLQQIDLSHMVLETDAPYLTPVPFRGKRNESSYLKFVAARLAEVKSTGVEEVARITTMNAGKIFGF